MTIHFKEVIVCKAKLFNYCPRAVLGTSLKLKVCFLLCKSRYFLINLHQKVLIIKIKNKTNIKTVFPVYNLPLLEGGFRKKSLEVKRAIAIPSPR